MLQILDFITPTSLRVLDQGFEHGMYLRQEADYSLKFSESGALDVIENAEKIFDRARDILKAK